MRGVAHVLSIEHVESETVVQFRAGARRVYKNVAADGKYLCLGADHLRHLRKMALNAEFATCGPRPKYFEPARN